MTEYVPYSEHRTPTGMDFRGTLGSELKGFQRVSLEEARSRTLRRAKALRYRGLRGSTALTPSERSFMKQPFKPSTGLSQGKSSWAIAHTVEQLLRSAARRAASGTGRAAKAFSVLLTLEKFMELTGAVIGPPGPGSAGSWVVQPGWIEVPCQWTADPVGWVHGSIGGAACDTPTGGSLLTNATWATRVAAYGSPSPFPAATYPKRYIQQYRYWKPHNASALWVHQDGGYKWVGPETGDEAIKYVENKPAWLGAGEQRVTSLDFTSGALGHTVHRQPKIAWRRGLKRKTLTEVAIEFNPGGPPNEPPVAVYANPQARPPGKKYGRKIKEHKTRSLGPKGQKFASMVFWLWEAVDDYPDWLNIIYRASGGPPVHGGLGEIIAQQVQWLATGGILNLDLDAMFRGFTRWAINEYGYAGLQRMLHNKQSPLHMREGIVLQAQENAANPFTALSNALGI